MQKNADNSLKARLKGQSNPSTSRRKIPTKTISYAIVFTNLLRLPNRSQWITAFFSLACIMKTDEGVSSSSESRPRFTWFGPLFCDCIKESSPLIHFSWVPQRYLLSCQCPPGCWYPHMLLLWYSSCINYLSYLIGNTHVNYDGRYVSTAVL